MEEALIKRVMPHSIEAEQSVVGAMLMDKDAITTAGEIISGDDFYQASYGVIFDSMIELFNEGKPVDLITLQERLKDLLPEIEQTLQNKHFGDTVLRNALFTQFMIYINRIFLRTSSSPDKKTYSSDTQVEQLLKYINRNLSENLSIDQLANRFFFSKYHMMRKFKNETGYTIHNYITSKRLLMARSLISQGMPVMKAAQASGFHDYTTFVRAYKKQFGKAPSCE